MGVCLIVSFASLSHRLLLFWGMEFEVCCVTTQKSQSVMSHSEALVLVVRYNACPKNCACANSQRSQTNTLMNLLATTGHNNELTTYAPTTAETTATNCPSQFHSTPSGCFYIVPQSLAWDQARVTCQAFGQNVDLASPDAEEVIQTYSVFL